MSEKQWVQHISGQGEKWEVYSSTVHVWHIKQPSLRPDYYLPKSEYVACDPPDVWRDVTDECKPYWFTFNNSDNNTAWYLSHECQLVKENSGYRLRKVQYTNSLSDPGWAFIVEKKVNP